MKWKIPKFYLYILPLSVLTSCSHTGQTVETAQVPSSAIWNTGRITPTIVATDTLSQSVIETQPCPKTTISPSETIMPAVLTAQSDENVTYYNGIVVIARYYTLLDQGLYEEAYKLLSRYMPHIKTLEDYVMGAKVALKKVQILVIQPYYEWAEQQGYSVRRDSKDKKRYFTQIIAEGEGNMAGSAMNGAVQTLFITLVLENGEWKIYSINTSPQ